MSSVPVYPIFIAFRSYSLTTSVQFYILGYLTTLYKFQNKNIIMSSELRTIWKTADEICFKVLSQRLTGENYGIREENLSEQPIVGP